MSRIMKRILRTDVLLVTAALGIVGVIAVFPQADDDPDHLPISDDLKPLITAFNAAPDHVRAILLASPT